MALKEQVLVIQGLGDTLRDLLRRGEWTQARLATAAGVSRQTLNRAVRRNEISEGVALRVAQALGVDLAKLIPPGTGASRPVNPPTDDDVIGRDGVAEAGYFDSWPIGRALELLRREVGESQESLAARVGISSAKYRRFISGANSLPGRELSRLALALGITRKSLLQEMEHYEEADRDDEADRQQAAGSSAQDDAAEFSDAEWESAWHTLRRNLTAWRRASGYDITGLAEEIGVEPIEVALWEVAAQSPPTDTLRVLASTYGIPIGLLVRGAEVIFGGTGDEAASWTTATPEDVARVEVAKVLADQQWFQRHNLDDYYSFRHQVGRRARLFRIRNAYMIEEAAHYAGLSANQLRAIEHATVDAFKAIPEVERLASLYGVTPWEVLYGDPLERASQFCASSESRVTLVARKLSHRTTEWLYRYLALLAARGLSDLTLLGVRSTLLQAVLNSEFQNTVDPDEQQLLILGRLVGEAASVWRLTQASQDDSSPPTGAGNASPPLPPLFAEFSEEERLHADQVARRLQDEESVRVRAVLYGPTGEDHQWQAVEPDTVRALREVARTALQSGEFETAQAALLNLFRAEAIVHARAMERSSVFAASEYEARAATLFQALSRAISEARTKLDLRRLFERTTDELLGPMKPDTPRYPRDQVRDEDDPRLTVGGMYRRGP